MPLVARPSSKETRGLAHLVATSAQFGYFHFARAYVLKRETSSSLSQAKLTLPSSLFTNTPWTNSATKREGTYTLQGRRPWQWRGGEAIQIVN